MRHFLFLMLSLLTVIHGSGQSTYGIFDHAQDVGPVKRKGFTRYLPETQTYELTGSGANIWYGKDELHYCHRKVTGDFLLQARGRLLGTGVDPHRKFGWMVRAGLDTNAVMVCATVHGDGLTAIQYRKDKGGNVEEVRTILFMPDVIQLERKGTSFVLSVTHSGKPLWSVEVPDITMPEEVYAGLFVCAHNANVSETAIFENVRVIQTVKEDFRPYQDYLGSHLEILDTKTGMRRVVYSTPEVIQAPNWTKDNKALIYNKHGSLFRFDLAQGTHTLINTDTITNNNNDHVLSFDGKILGLSGTPEGGSGSWIYTVPVEGGVPKQITPLNPSYLHGWSPDNEWLVYTAQRNGDFDIYRIPSSGGVEQRLTETPGLDDGAEYSPDGKYIYYNSVRNGKMEIWRMTSEGKDHVQLTDDEYQNWFPHISPDGTQMLFVSFPPETELEDHPFYKQVYLRMIPLQGGDPKVIGYVYGGQGSINVPSWSPDSRHVAFVSNSGF